MFPAAIFGFSEPLCHLPITHFNRFGFGVNGTVGRQTIDLALLIADDSHIIIKGHIFLDVAANNLLHCFKCVINLNHFGVLVRLNEQNGNLIYGCFFRLFAKRFVKGNRLKPEAVHKEEALFECIAFPDFHHIRHGKRACLIVCRMFNVEFPIDAFKGAALHFAAINLVVNGGVDFL